MGAVEHLKTLCCLGLKPETAIFAVTPLLHEIVPHGCSRLALVAPDGTITRAYAENPQPERYSGSVCGGSWMIHRPWHHYGILYSAPWASVGRCTGRGATISKAGER
jgi:hypothetical protein